MTDKGIAHIGIGHAKGDDKAVEAVKQAVASPLLETTIEGATHVIINISGDISLIEANEAASYVQELAGDDANIFKPKMPSGLNLNTQSRTAAAEASATAPKAAPQLHAQAPTVKPVQTQAPQQTASAQTAAPSQGSYRPLNQTQINIPDFLKNKR